MPVMDPQPPDRVRYVFDEGDLLQRIPREINRTWSDICEGYRLYVTCNYSQATVVSDGYLTGHTPNDGVHAKWNKSQSCPLVNFILNMKCALSKDTLLSDKASKQSVIDKWPVTGAGLQQM